MPIDYATMARLYPKQKAALTRAQRKPTVVERQAAVLATCKKTVAEWDANGGAWPDDRSRWQRALADVYPTFDVPRLEDLNR